MSDAPVTTVHVTFADDVRPLAEHFASADDAERWADAMATLWPDARIDVDAPPTCQECGVEMDEDTRWCEECVPDWVLEEARQCEQTKYDAESAVRWEDER